MPRAPMIRDRRTAILVGLAGLGVAWWALYDAYDARGREVPRILRPLTWW